ncbi:cell division control protein 45 homolog [Anthonomus grandis grandis]|uniref:cell division control protein 45 homolog n=1 Tax=Anthonomus grandis grandis TaxID=2921223 RepID=UPI00216624B5|nr:cell division control protein 45 homolog [Anthonomus grandis grandis]
MFVSDLKKEFYEFLAGKRIFLMIHYDIDSICACKILQSLLKYRNILYTLAIVRGKEDLKRAYLENCEDVKYFVLINCGGTIDIVEELEAEEDVVFFILDSHRPLDLYNIYSNEQVRLLSAPEGEALVPEFDDIFRDETDSEGDSENESDDDEGRAAKRRRLGEEEIMKRREKRLWEENRSKLLFEYSQFTYYARASAISMFDFAWKLNKDDKDLLWLAIVALTEQLLFGKIENAQYTIEMESLRAHCKRLQNKTNDTDVQTSLKILFEKDLRLTLYRHWTVEQSLKYSMFTAVRLKLWTLKGDKKIHELLAEMGLPLVQSRQHFKSMDLQLRKEFHTSIEKLADKYGLQDIEFVSFILQYGFRNKFCASDIVYALLAILEASPRDKKPEELFNLALDCLSRTKMDVVNSAIERSKIIVKSLFKTVQGALDMKQIITAGPFVYYVIQEGCLDWYMYSHLHILSLLAHFILKAYVSMSRNRKAATLPLIVSAPKDIDAGTCILLGIPPVCENSPRNFFGKAFEQAADRMKCDVNCDYLDTSYIELHVKDRTRFFDALAALLN